MNPRCQELALGRLQLWAGFMREPAVLALPGKALQRTGSTTMRRR
jgi:hypothetical protein